MALLYNGGVGLLNLEDPLAPVVVDTLDATRRARAVVWQLCVADARQGILILDLEKPETPRLVGSLSSPLSPSWLVAINSTQPEIQIFPLPCPP